MSNRKTAVRLFFVSGTVFVLLAGMLFMYNLREDMRAAQLAEDVMEKFHAELEDSYITDEADSQQFINTENSIPDFILNPDMEMPAEEIDGNKYIGYLMFPTIDAELPVMSSLSYAGLKTAPCLYTGSVYKGNAVIAAHNYKSNFGQLFDLESGDPVTFVDVDGNIFRYEIVIREVLDPKAIEEMICGDFDLTLFTCTYGGKKRFTVRCRLYDAPVLFRTAAGKT